MAKGDGTDRVAGERIVEIVHLEHTARSFEFGELGSGEADLVPYDRSERQDAVPGEVVTE